VTEPAIQWITGQFSFTPPVQSVRSFTGHRLAHRGTDLSSARRTRHDARPMIVNRGVLPPELKPPTSTIVHVIISADSLSFSRGVNHIVERLIIIKQGISRGPQSI